MQSAVVLLVSTAAVSNLLQQIRNSCSLVLYAKLLSSYSSSASVCSPGVQCTADAARSQ